MAASHSTANHLLPFPGLLETVFKIEVRRTDQVRAAQLLHRSLAELPKCSYEEVWGNAAVFHCGSRASVTDLDSEEPLCLRHFEAVHGE